MATCPNCKGLMDAMATVCPHCSYDFPPLVPEKTVRPGIAYTALADFALVVGMISAVLGVIVTLVFMGTVLFTRNFLVAALSVIPFFLQVALFVVYRRVADLN